MSGTFEWDTDDRYRSNNGDGPGIARILCVADGKAEMERWQIARGRAGNTVRFTLPISYLQSSNCGWKKVSS